MGILNIIVIDDEQSILDGMNRVLHKIKPQWNVKYVVNPVNGLEYIQDNIDKIDVVICDINMPAMSGIQIVQEVYKTKEKIIRILLSGQLDIKSLIGANKFADCHICKPVDMDILVNKINELYISRCNGDLTKK